MIKSFNAKPQSHKVTKNVQQEIEQRSQSKRKPYRPALSSILLAIAVLAYATYFSYLTLVRYAAFEARALDLGNMDQAVWNTAQGNWFHLTNQPGTVNRLSLHVEPILVPISWLYWLHSGPETLLGLQAIVVALGALPLFGLARHKLKNEWLALLFAVAFLLNPTMQAANWLEFHPLTLAPTLIMAAFFFLVTDRPRWYTLFALLAAACKEEIALLIFMIGLYAFVVLHRRRLGAITMVLALSWALLAVLVIQNTFADGNIHWGRYQYLGETPLQIVLTLLTKPSIVLAQLQAADSLWYLLLLLLPVGFTALLAPEILLLALPSLGINLLADSPPMHQVNELIYAAPIAPFVLMAAVQGTTRVLAFAARIEKHSARNLRYTHLLLAVVIGGCALFAQRQYGYLPGGGNYQHFTVNEHHRRAAAIIAQIPPDAKVSAQDRLNPHVSGRETVYIFPRIEDADTVFVDVTGPAWPQHPNDTHQTVNQLLANGFGVAAAADGYLLLRKGIATQTMPPSFYTAWRKPDYTPAAPRAIDFDDSLRLLDYQATTDSHGELVVNLTWQALKPIARDLRFYVAYLDAKGTVLHDTQFYPPVAVLWYPTSLWETEAPVMLQTLPWRLATDHFTLVLGVYEGEDGWPNGQRLSLTQTEPALPRLENNTVARLGGYQRTANGAWAPVLLQTEAAALRLDAHFGEAITLNGATVPEQTVRAGAELPFTLYWQADQPPDFDYAVFAHLLDANGEKAAQLDWQPHDAIGLLPATAWIVGQPVVDAQVLTLPETLTPGEYQLVVGLYNWQDGQRVPVTGADAEQSDVVRIAHILVQ